MRILRWVIVAILAALGLYKFVPLILMGGAKTGLLEATGDNARFLPLAQAMPWWLLGSWAVLIGLYLFTAWRLAKLAPAALVFLGILVLEGVGWWAAASEPTYAQAFTEPERQADYVIFAVLAVIGLLVWWLDRKSASNGSSAQAA